MYRYNTYLSVSDLCHLYSALEYTRVGRAILMCYNVQYCFSKAKI